MDQAKARATNASVRRRYGQLIARAWSDPKFLAQLQADPKKVLVENGWPLSPELKVRVVADTPTAIHIVLPPQPSGKLSDERLAVVTAEGSVSTAGSIACAGCPTSTAGSIGTSGCWGGEA